MIRGHTHLADGAEASIVGSLAALEPDDQVLATYRCHGYPLVLGTDPKAMMAEIYGRETGLCKGYGGSMHLTDVERGFLGTSGIVAQGIPHATGAAYAAQIRGKGQVVLGFFGDGASKQGAFHESLNIASLWKLPIVFVMENNSYNVVTRVEQEDANAAAGEPLAVKAKAYSMPGTTVDGGDPVAVYEQVSAAVEPRALGRGADARRVARLPPERPRQHHRPARRPAPLPGARGDHRLRRAEEYEAAKRGDPVPRFRARLVTDGTLSAEEADAIAEAVAGRDAGGGRLRAREPVPGAGTRRRLRLRLGGAEPWHASFPTSPRSARRSTRRWSATRPSSTSARTSPPPRTTRSCRRSAATASA